MERPGPDTAVRLPAPALRSFISKYAGCRLSGLPPGFNLGLPSNDIHLIISLGEPVEVVRMPTSKQSPASMTAMVAGFQNGPTVVRQRNEAFGLHVFIKPLGAHAVLGIPSKELASWIVDLSDICGTFARNLICRLRSARTWKERFDSLDSAFLSRLQTACLPPEIEWAWTRLEKAHGAVPVESLASEAGWGRRHFTERFREVLGATPKSAARVFRFERAIQLLFHGGLGLADVACTAGYSDQAHMTREWRELAGCTPRAWISGELPFIQDYEIRGSDTRSDESHSVLEPRV